MFTAHLTIALLLFAGVVVRQLTLKTCAHVITHHMVGVFVSFWVMAGAVISLPFFGHMLMDGDQFIFADKPWILLLGILKGIVLWQVIALRQPLVKESMSAAMFIGFIAVGVISVTNYLFVGEVLSPLQWASVLTVSLLGVAFFSAGPGRTLSKQGRKLCLYMMGFIIFFTATDYTVIRETNWYTHYVLSSIGLLAGSLWRRVTWQEWVAVLRHGAAIRAGVVWVVTEMLILGSMVTIFPVPIVFLLMNLSAPVVMVVSAVFWHEGCWKKQAAFGAAACAAVTPLILF